MNTQQTELIANQFFAEQAVFAERNGIFTSTDRIAAAYETRSLIGAVTDSQGPGGETLPHDLRQYARNCRAEFRDAIGVNEYRFATASGTGAMYGDYKGQLCIPYRHHMQIDPVLAYKGAQLTGDCVSWSKRSMRDHARCFDIGHLNEAEEYVKRSATADLYSMRGHTGAGASPSRIALAATKIGILLEMPVESASGEVWDFSDYKSYYKLGMQYGRTGFPRWIYEANAAYGPKQVAEIDTEEELLTALWNGCGVGIGSMIGVSKTGGKDGVKFLSSLSGSWAHDMAVCFSRDTEILTQEGWKPIDQAGLNDEFATLNPDSHELEWQRASHMHAVPFQGDMLHFKKRGLDFMVTPDHRMYGIKQCRTHAHGTVTDATPDKFEFSFASDVSPSFRAKRTAKWVGAEIVAHELPRGTRVPMDVWLEFLGYYLSEGSTFYIKKMRNRKRVLVDGTVVHEKKKSIVNRVSISQRKEEGVEIIGQLLEKLPFRFRRVTDRWDCDWVELYEELARLGKSYEKNIPDYVWDCSERQLRILFEAMCVGDGSKNAKGEWIAYHTSSPSMAGDFQRLLLQIGKSGKVANNGITGFAVRDSYTVSIRGSHDLAMVGKPDRVPYDDTVFCPTTKNGVVYVRRNGKAAWCGNCGYDDTRKYHRETIIIWDQSWGIWNHIKASDWPVEYGPMPEGAFALTLTDTMKAVRGGECHALSDSVGFRPRRQATLGAAGLI